MIPRQHPAYVETRNLVIIQAVSKRNKADANVPTAASARPPESRIMRSVSAVVGPNRPISSTANVCLQTPDPDPPDPDRPRAYSRRPTTAGGVGPTFITVSSVTVSPSPENFRW